MAHEPIQFGPTSRKPLDDAVAPSAARPNHLDLQKDRALTVTWDDGRVSIYPVAYLRRMSPSAEARALREEMKRNPLAVLPASGGGDVVAEGAELVGNYALRIRFSDGHDTGIYSWSYLREIDPLLAAGQAASPDDRVRP